MLNKKIQKMLLLFFCFVIILTSVFIYFKIINNGEHTVQIIPTPEKIKVLSFNINHGEDQSDGYGLKKIIEIIKNENPDFVTLNDVDKKAIRTYREDQARKIAGNLGMYFTFGNINKLNGGWNGNAILSKYPLIYSENRFYKDAIEDEKQTLLYGAFQAGNLKIHIFTTVLSENEDIAENQNQEIINQVIDHVAKHAVNDPVILTGSFNMDYNHSSIKEMNTYFLNSTKKISENNKLTYPAIEPNQQFDYIFYRKNVKLLSGKVINNNFTRNSSDHLPVVAEFQFK